MNWVKTRLSIREDKLRMKQREFFAKKKLEKQTEMMRQVHQSGPGMSLDLLAVNISNREKPKAGNQPPPKVVKVDLDKLNPYRRRVQNVDLGPLSPSKRSLVLHPDTSSAKRSIVSDVPSMPWQPSSFLSSQPVPAASRSARRDILPPMMPQTKFLQTTHQIENSRARTQSEQKTSQLTLSNSFQSEPETPFVPFSKPGPRVTFNNKTETWSYSGGSSSSEKSSNEKPRSSSSSAFPKTRLLQDSSPFRSTSTTQRRRQMNVFETEDFQEVSEPCVTENWCRAKDRGNDKHSTNTRTSDFEVLKESSCLAEKYHFQDNGSRFLREISSTESECKARFLPTLKSRMSTTDECLMSFSGGNTSGEQNQGRLNMHAGRYSDFHDGRILVDQSIERRASVDASANYAPSYETRRKLGLDGKDSVKCWISRNNEQPSTQSLCSPKVHCTERRKSEQDFLPESPFTGSSIDKCSGSVVEIGREDIDDWIIRENSGKGEVLKTKEKMLKVEVEPDVLFASRVPQYHNEERNLRELTPAQVKRSSMSGVTDITITEQGGPLSMQSLLADESARSFIQEAKDSVGSESPSESWSDSSSSEDERSSILSSSCPSTKSFVKGRLGHQHRNNCRNRAAAGGDNRQKECIVDGEDRAVPNSWLLFVRGETQAPVTGSHQLSTEATAAQVVADQNAVDREHSCSESSGNSWKKSADEKVKEENSLQSPTTRESDTDSHKRATAEENESRSLGMATPTHGDSRTTSRLVAPELGDSNSLRMATVELADTNCFSCQAITYEAQGTIAAAAASDVHNSDETVQSAACITEQPNFGTRNTTKCVSTVGEAVKVECGITDNDADPVENTLNNDKTFFADTEPPPKKYKCFRELLIGDNSSWLSIVDCETPTRSESPVLMTSSIQTSSFDVLSPCIHSSHSSSALLVTAGTQTSPICAPLTANACTSPVVNSWTADAQSSPVFFPLLQPVVQGYASLNCLGVDVSSSPAVFQPVKSSDVQLSPVFQCKTTDAQLSPIFNFFSTNDACQSSPLLAENPESLLLQKCFASDMQALATSGETKSNLLNHSSIFSIDQLLLPLCADPNVETVHTAECSAQSKPAQNPSDLQEQHHHSNICLDTITNKQDDSRGHADAMPEGFGYSVAAEATVAFDGKPQVTTEEQGTPQLSRCSAPSDCPSLSDDVSFMSVMDRFQQNEDEVDKSRKTDCFGSALDAKGTISCSVGLQSNTPFKRIEEEVIGGVEVLDDHDQCSTVMAEESCITASFEVDKLSENDCQKLGDCSLLLSEDPTDAKVPDLVLFNSDVEESSCASVDKKRHHSLDCSSDSSSVYSSPMG